MTQKISLIMPTRNRFDLASQFIKSLEKNTSHPNKVELLIYVDNDDDKSLKLKSKIIPVKIYSGKKLSMGGYNTYLFEKSSGDIIMLVNDDIKVLTPHWDKKIRDLNLKFSDKIYLGYPNDLNKKDKLCTFPIISKETAIKLTRPFPSEYKGAFIDLHLLDIFKRLEKVKLNRIIYLEDVIFEHLHFRTGKSQIDETYIKRDRFEDDDTFHNLKKFREEQAYNLIKNKVIKKNKLNIKVKNSKLSFLKKYIFSIVYFFENKLPIKWRLYLFFFFLARTTFDLVFCKRGKKIKN